MKPHPIIEDMIHRMETAVNHTLHEFATVHTGKASPAMVEGVMVDAYGSPMRLKDVAAITTPDARLIVVQPWDKSLVKPIEKALQVANLGINPAVDGAVIRLPLPELSRERRQELVKVVHRLAEEGRVALRNIRRDAIDQIKKLEKNHEISEDDARRLEKEVQQHMDRFSKSLGDHAEAKEKELLSL
ncbi:MAG: ribosome recycling factor [Verrucomicrobia bacterium]|nr:MAG: ribosome recycling factor [Verrucomicrobiota bacterium]